VAEILQQAVFSEAAIFSEAAVFTGAGVFSGTAVLSGAAVLSAICGAVSAGGVLGPIGAFVQIALDEV
jgi:hypothetical protein